MYFPVERTRRLRQIDLKVWRDVCNNTGRACWLREHCPRDRRRSSATARLLELWVRIPP